MLWKSLIFISLFISLQVKSLEIRGAYEVQILDNHFIDSKLSFTLDSDDHGLVLVKEIPLTIKQMIKPGENVRMRVSPDPMENEEGVFLFDELVAIEEYAHFEEFEENKIRTAGVLVVDTNDYKTSQYNSLEKISKILDKTQQYYEVVSRGKIKFNFQEYQKTKKDIYKVKIDSTVKGRCRPFSMARKARKKFYQEQGRRFNRSYDHEIYVFPDHQFLGCGYSGVGTIGLTKLFVGTKVFILRKKVDLHIFVHELGHNLGLKHSSRDKYAYGDWICPMGKGKGHFNPVKLDQLNFLNRKYQEFIEVKKSGQYTLAPLSAKSSTFKRTPHYLKIDKRLVASKNDLFISYRTPINLDARWPNQNVFLNRKVLSIHQKKFSHWFDFNGVNSKLMANLDVTQTKYFKYNSRLNVKVKEILDTGEIVIKLNINP